MILVTQLPYLPGGIFPGIVETKTVFCCRQGRFVDYLDTRSCLISVFIFIIF